jgi:hypothetical protein
MSTAEPVVGAGTARPVGPPAVAEIVARHRLVPGSGKCVWCGCNWPCDARVLALEIERQGWLIAEFRKRDETAEAVIANWKRRAENAEAKVRAAPGGAE